MSSKFVARFFAVIVVLISDAMCAVVAYNYCTLQWGGEYEIGRASCRERV